MSVCEDIKTGIYTFKTTKNKTKSISSMVIYIGYVKNFLASKRKFEVSISYRG